MTAAMKQCPGCAGAGTVKRTRRVLDGGMPDPLDFQGTELCPACSGGGSVPERPSTRAVNSGGSIIDTFSTAPVVPLADSTRDGDCG